MAAPAWPTLLFVGLLWLALFGMARSEWSVNDQCSYGRGVPLLGLYLILRHPKVAADTTAPANPVLRRDDDCLHLGG